MLEYVLVFIFNFTFIAFKTLEVKSIQHDERVKSTLLAGGLTAVWFFGTAIGLKNVLDGDWIISAFYIAGAMLGRWCTLKTKPHK